MRVTGPTVRRRNHAWLQMRSLDRQAARLARRQEEPEELEEDSADEADASGDELDSSGDESASSLDESDDELDEEEDEEEDEEGAEPTETVPPVPAPVDTGLPTLTARPLGPGLALGAVEGTQEAAAPEEEAESDSDGEESADESTTATSSSSTSTITDSSSSGSSTTVTGPGPTESSTSSLDELVTSLTGTSRVATSTSAPLPSIPITGSNQDQVDPPNSEANERGMGIASQGGLESGQIAGIVLGVLAFTGLLVGAVFFWRKLRQDRGLPFFPAPAFRLKDDDESGTGPAVSGPLPGNIARPTQVRTNTEIMDDLMKAAYASNNGTNEMEGAYAPPAVPKLPPQLPPQPHEHEHAVGLGFMDEKAYAALAGPPTPATPKKPVMRWLDEVKPPSMPNGPQIPPTPEMPASARTSRVMGGGGRAPEPPKPTYYGRDTMTTDTTTTSVRWYG